MLSALGENDEAILCFKEAVKIDSSCTQALYNLGRTYKDCKQYSTAIDYYAEATKRKQDFSMAWHKKGEVYHIMGPEYHDRAIQCYQEAGSLYFIEKDYTNAGLCYSSIIKIDSQNVAAWKQLGDVYTAKENSNNAKRCYDKAEQSKRKQEEKTAFEPSKRVNLGKIISDNPFKAPLPVSQQELEFSNPSSPPKIPQQQVQQQTLINEAVGSLEIFFKDVQKNSLFKDGHL